MLAAGGKTRWALPGQLVLHHQPSGECQNEGHDRHGDRAAHAIGRDRQRDVRGGTGGHIHRVITDAKAGDDTEPSAFGCAFGRKTVSQQDKRVEVFKIAAAQRIGVVQKSRLHAGGL